MRINAIVQPEMRYIRARSTGRSTQGPAGERRLGALDIHRLDLAYDELDTRGKAMAKGGSLAYVRGTI